MIKNRSLLQKEQLIVYLFVRFVFMAKIASKRNFQLQQKLFSFWQFLAFPCFLQLVKFWNDLIENVWSWHLGYLCLQYSGEEWSNFGVKCSLKEENCFENESAKISSELSEIRTNPQMYMFHIFQKKCSNRRRKKYFVFIIIFVLHL